MMSLPTALGLAFRQLGDPVIVRILTKSLLVTLVIFMALGAVLLTALYRTLMDFGLAWSAELSAIAAILLTVLAGWLLFRFVAIFVLQFFAEEVVRAVEARHYPNEASAARSLTFGEEMRKGLRAGLRALGVNLIALPFAIFLLVTGVGTALLFWGVNALLLGRELQDMVWLRHRVDEGELAPIRGGPRFLLGGAIAGLLMLPFANLLAPVVGAAAATHLVHRGRAAHA